MPTKDNPTADAIKRLRAIANKPLACYLFWLRDIRLLLKSHSELGAAYHALQEENDELKLVNKRLRDATA